MTTTVMRDSIVGDNWIYNTAQAVPVQRVMDEKTGEPTGDVLTGPVRLAFETLFELPQPTQSTPNPKFGASLLFTPYADFSIFYEEYYAACAAEFSDHYDAASGQYYGLHSPFRDQGEKLKFGGYTPGLIFMTCTSKFKPPVVDARGNPIVDKSKVYPGVWAICAVNKYTYKDPRKKGVGFGLQSVMIIGDDTKLGGGAPDPNKTFAAAKGAIQAPTISPSAVQGMPQGGGQPPHGAPQTHAAPPPPGGTYAAPPAPSGPPGGHTPPAGQFTPPGAPQGGYQMPGQPAADPRGAPPNGFATWAEYDDLMG